MKEEESNPESSDGHAVGSPPTRSNSSQYLIPNAQDYYIDDIKLNDTGNRKRSVQEEPIMVPKELQQSPELNWEFKK